MIQKKMLLKAFFSPIGCKFTIFNEKAHVVLKRYSLLAKIPLFRVLRGSLGPYHLKVLLARTSITMTRLKFTVNTKKEP